MKNYNKLVTIVSFGSQRPSWRVSYIGNEYSEEKDQRRKSKCGVLEGHHKCL